MKGETSHMYLARTKPLKHLTAQIRPEQTSPFLLKDSAANAYTMQ